MPEVYLKINTHWKPTSERGSVVHTVRNHYGEGANFTRLCTGIIFSVLKVLAVAIQTRNQAAIQSAIEVSKVQIESYYQMALGLAQPEIRVPALIETAPNNPGGTLPARTDDLTTSLVDVSQAEFEDFESLVMDD